MQKLNFKNRLYFGAKLEPREGILAGAGQDLSAWREYSAMIRPYDLSPDFFMEYLGVKGFKDSSLEKLNAYLELSQAKANLLQLGLSMTRDGSPEEAYEKDVATGLYDDQIKTLGHFLKSNKLPTILRIGYECSSPWNGYSPETYIEAFRRVVSILKPIYSDIAFAWCVEGGWTANAFEYYPGDAWVDWTSVDLFAVDHFEKTEGFMAQCLDHQKPVLVGECTPRRVGVLNGEESWNTWFHPFLQWIEKHPHVKGFSYIHWNWAGYPQWKDWGDARIAQNPVVQENWIQFLRSIQG